MSDPENRKQTCCRCGKVKEPRRLKQAYCAACEAAHAATRDWAAVWKRRKTLAEQRGTV